MPHELHLAKCSFANTLPGCQHTPLQRSLGRLTLMMEKSPTLGRKSRALVVGFLSLDKKQGCVMPAAMGRNGYGTYIVLETACSCPVH